MTTQYEHAKAGEITPQMQRVAGRENLSVEVIRDELAAGRLVIPANRLHVEGVRSTGVPPVSSSVGHARDQGEETHGQDARATTNHGRDAHATHGQDARATHGQDGHATKDNHATKLDPCGIGRALSTKINANIGASPVSSCKDEELLKLQWAVKFGADAVMDLSTGGDLDATRTFLIANSAVPIGTVPMYSMIVNRKIEELTRKDILDGIRRQAAQGVDFFTIHAGLLRRHLPLAVRRKMGIVSRGGSLLAKWMLHHGCENPMYEMFDEISAIMREYDVTYSLGDGLRPGCLADASDAAQFAELDVLGELVQRARKSGVQVMVEGPGHVPFNQIQANMERQAKVCGGAPFYVLGPLVTDVFPGYDHITSAIGATAAAYWGASFLCYVTPSEHLGLPNPQDVKQGCIAYKIAAHSADVARGLPGARDWDDRMADARAELDWQGQFAQAFDPQTAKELRHRDLPHDKDYCSMCGHDWCAVRISKEVKQSIADCGLPATAGKLLAD